MATCNKKWLNTLALIGFVLMLLAIIALRVFAQSVVSPHREITPESYKFGPLTAISPFNNAPNYTAVSTLGQLQPSGLMYGSSTFASTGDFTAAQAGCTFSVASSVGTLACPGSNAESDLYLTTFTAMNAPSIFISVTIQSNGTASAGVYDNAGLHLIKNSSNMIGFELDHRNNFVVYDHVISGTRTTSNTAFTIPSAPWSFGVSFVANNMCAWDNTGSGWKLITCQNVSGAYDFTTSGNLSGWAAGLDERGANASTWTFKNFAAGAFGGVGVRDLSLVTFADGRPYMNGPVAYFTTTTVDGQGNGIDGVWAYNVLTQSLSEAGQIFDNRGGHVYNDVASHLVYDPGLAEWRYMTGGWATTSSPETWYNTWLKSFCDPTAGGICVASGAATALTGLNSIAWDAHFVCSAWNYTTATCGKWLVGWANATTQGADYTTSDPSANSFTSIGSFTPPSSGIIEGDRWLRTPLGTGGVGYEVVACGDSTKDSRFANTYSSSSLTQIGSLAINLPGGAQNCPHGQIFEFGNTEYFVSFDASRFGTAVNTMGNFVVASAPKDAAQTNYPLGVQETSAFSGSVVASITSSAIPVTSGNLMVVYCRGGNGTSVSSVALSQSTSTGTPTGVGFNNITTGSGTGYGEMFSWYANATNASVTFTCTPSASEQFQGITVLEFTPGYLTTTDGSGILNQLGSSNAVYTSGTFSTTASKGLVVVCADGLFGASMFVPGFIGPYKAGYSAGLMSGAAACMSTITSAVQTNITANMGTTTTGSPAQWGGAYAAFK